MRFDGKNTKQKITDYSLGELSSVKKGAQGPAKMAIIKTTSSGNTESLLQNALQGKYQDGDKYLFVEDFDDAFVSYRLEGMCYAVGYSIQDGVVTLIGEPVEVVRQSFYQAADGTKSFFKTLVDSAMAGAGLDVQMAPAIAKADVTGAADLIDLVDDQVAAIAVRFGKAVTASVGGEQHPASDFAYVPDPEKPSTWKLPIFDARHVAAAEAALGSNYRGEKVIIPDEDRGKVVSAVRAAFEREYPDKELPDVLKKSIEESAMPEQLKKELDAANSRIQELEVIAKMSDGEKAYMDKMDDKEKAKFMGMTPDERKKMMQTTKAADESFTSLDGQIIAKSAVGDGAFAMLKAQDDRLRKMEDESAMRKAGELVDAICPDLPGTRDEKAGAIRKAQDLFTAGEFDVLKKALSAGNAAMKVRKSPAAHSQEGAPDLSTAKKAYEDGIAKLAADNQISKVQAMQSPEGLKLAKAFKEAQEAE